MPLFPESNPRRRLIPLKSKITTNLVDERTCQRSRRAKLFLLSLFLKFDKTRCLTCRTQPAVTRTHTIIIIITNYGV